MRCLAEGVDVRGFILYEGINVNLMSHLKEEIANEFQGFPTLFSGLSPIVIG
jgi:hypothetical protein